MDVPTHLDCAEIVRRLHPVPHEAADSLRGALQQVGLAECHRPHKSGVCWPTCLASAPRAQPLTESEVDLSLEGAALVGVPFSISETQSDEQVASETFLL